MVRRLIVSLLNNFVIDVYFGDLISKVSVFQHHTSIFRIPETIFLARSQTVGQREAGERGMLNGYSTGLVIEMSWVRVLPAAAGELFSSGQLSVLIHFGIRSTPVLPQYHVKYPGHSAKSAGGRLELNTHTPYACGFA